MELPILIEPTAFGRYRARVGEPLDEVAEADDVAGAVRGLVMKVEQRLLGGAKLGVLTMTNGSIYGSATSMPADDAYKSDWVYHELTQAIAENRRAEDGTSP